MKKILSFIAASILAIAIASPAMAASASGSVSVTASLQPSCSVGSGATVDFGPISLQADGTPGYGFASNSFYIWCTNTTPFTISALGSVSGGYLLTGNGTGASKKIAYNISTNSGMNFGVTGSGAGPFTGTGQGVGTPASINLNLSVTGQAAGNSIPGAYSDSITVAVTY